MNIELWIETKATVTNAGGEYYLAIPYTSSVGRAIEQLSVNVPIQHKEPSCSDRKALLEAVTLQGHIGRWIEKDDGEMWLTPAK